MSPGGVGPRFRRPRRAGVTPARPAQALLVPLPPTHTSAAVATLSDFLDSLPESFDRERLGDALDPCCRGVERDGDAWRIAIDEGDGEEGVLEVVPRDDPRPAGSDGDYGDFKARYACWSYDGPYGWFQVYGDDKVLVDGDGPDPVDLADWLDDDEDTEGLEPVLESEDLILRDQEDGTWWRIDHEVGRLETAPFASLSACIAWELEALADAGEMADEASDEEE